MVWASGRAGWRRAASVTSPMVVLTRLRGQATGRRTVAIGRAPLRPFGCRDPFTGPWPAPLPLCHSLYNTRGFPHSTARHRAYPDGDTPTLMRPNSSSNNKKQRYGLPQRVSEIREYVIRLPSGVVRFPCVKSQGARQTDDIREAHADRAGATGTTLG